MTRSSSTHATRPTRHAATTPAAAHTTTLSSEDPQSANAAPLGQRLLLTPQETADALGISRCTLYRLYQRGEIPSLTIGTRRYFSRKGIEEWIAQRLVA